MFILYIPKVQRTRTFTTTTQRFHPVLYRVIAVGNKTNGLQIFLFLTVLDGQQFATTSK